jgi:hypothetical protein
LEARSCIYFMDLAKIQGGHWGDVPQGQTVAG